MHKLKLIATLSAVVLLALPTLSTAQVRPNTAKIQAEIEATKREREALVAEELRLKAELEALSRESRSLGAAVKSLDVTRKKLLNDINITHSKINSSTLTIRSLETSLDEKARQIEVHREAIRTAIQKLSEYDSQSMVYLALASNRISDFWSDSGSLSKLGGELDKEIAALRDTRLALEKEKEIKEATVKELKSLESELGGQKGIVEESKKAQEMLLSQTKSREASYAQLLADNIARQKAAEADLYALESELKITIDPSLIPQPKGGLLAWPLDNVYLTQRFGVTAGSARLYASGSHNGIDFRAAYGTPVKAMLSGVVEGAGNTDEQRGCYSYGRWILIRHSNGLSTIYAHLSASLVRKGDVVATGQMIGYSGGTPGTNGAGYSTGPHLHVGLFASQGVEVRQFTTSKGCKQVFVPIADTRAYLDPLAYLPGF